MDLWYFTWISASLRTWIVHQSPHGLIGCFVMRWLGPPCRLPWAQLWFNELVSRLLLCPALPCYHLLCDLEVSILDVCIYFGLGFPGASVSP